MTRTISIAAAAGAAFIAACTPRPDLTVGVAAAPTSGAPGDPLAIESEIRNEGLAEAPTPEAPGSDVSTSMDIFLVETTTTPIGPFLAAWGPSAALAPGAVERHRAETFVPSVPAGDYQICGDVDRVGAVAESDETNNRGCTPFTVAGAPDLVITSVTPLGMEQASFQIRATVANQGSVDAGLFRLDVFQRSPERWPLLTTECALTPAERAAGGSAPCGAVFVESLAAGTSVDLEAYVTLPSDRASGATERVDVTADGCHAETEPAPGLPGWCRVAESDETNNAAEVEISAP